MLFLLGGMCRFFVGKYSVIQQRSRLGGYQFASHSDRGERSFKVSELLIFYAHQEDKFSRFKPKKTKRLFQKEGAVHTNSRVLWMQHPQILV